MKHLITLEDYSSQDILEIFSIAEDLKAKFQKQIREPLFPARVLGLLFEKPSLRTRVSFEAGMTHLGGSAMYLGQDVGFGKRESLADFGSVLSTMVDVIVVRAKNHATVAELSQYCTCPVINGLTDFSHPCQAIADVFTLKEQFGTLKDLTVSWVGDANNVAFSLALACAKLGIRLVMATPPDYRFEPEKMAILKAQAEKGFQLIESENPAEAVSDASAIYTDVWASMGQEKQEKQRKKDFGPYQVNASLMKKAPSNCVFMHCLPAKRGLEVTDEVMDGPQSIVVPQAANRMHAQKGILVWLLRQVG
jgi:ornithine carbamoyltransferase